MADTIFKNTTRFAARGYFGITERPPIFQQAVFGRAWRQLQGMGNVTNLILYGQDEKARVMLNYGTIYPDEWNVPAAWDAFEGGAPIQVPAEAFVGGIGGLSHQDGGLDAKSRYVTNTPVIQAGKPHTINFQLAKPDPGQKGARWWYQWWIWRFEIRQGRAYCYRLTDAWTFSLETELDYYRKLEDRSVDQQVRINEIEALIYADGKSVSKSGSDNWYEGEHEISFIPDDSGRFSVVIEGEFTGDSTDVEDKRLTKTRNLGQLWPNCSAQVGSNGGAYAWQLGRPDFDRKGSVRLKTMQLPPEVGSDDFDVSYRGSLNGGSVTSEVLTNDEVNCWVQMTLTSDGLSSPVVYSVSAYCPPSPRTGGDTLAFDSATELDQLGQPRDIIADVNVSFEKQGRKISAALTLFNVNGYIVQGSAFPGVAGGHQVLHDRVGDIWANSVPVISGGLIQTASSNNMKSANTNQARTGWAQPDTEVYYTVSDMRAFAAEYKISNPIEGDNKLLGAHILAVLQMVGYKPGQLAGINPASGVLLPKAVGSEDPAVQPSYKCPADEYLMRLVEKYGMGWRLTCNTGVWTFAPRDFTVKAAFSTSSTYSNLDTRMIEKINYDLPRDFGDSFNAFPVVGGNDENGNPIIKVWRFRESYRSPNHESFIGRIKEYDHVQDKGLVTPDRVVAAARSVALFHGQPGLFAEFRTVFIAGLYPEDRITLDGVLFEIERISDASTKDNTMRIAARKVVAMAGSL